MRVDLRFAALDQLAEQRVRIAARLLAAHGREARVAAWDGTRCDAVVVATGDGYGQHVLEIAQRRGCPVVAAGGCAADLAAALHHALGLVRDAATVGSPPLAHERQRDTIADRTTSRERDVPGLVQLAGESFRGGDVTAGIGGRVVILSGATGRASAGSLSDLLAARDHLGDAQWQLHALPAGATQGPADASMSLDAFFLTGALRAKATLPPFRSGLFALREWPDLGAAAEAIDALRIARLLQRAPATPQALAKQTNLPACDVDACLWAFEASNLLVESGPVKSVVDAPPADAARPEPPSRRLLSRLAARFGLMR